MTARGGLRSRMSRSSGSKVAPAIPTPKSRELMSPSRRILELVLEGGEKRERRDRSQVVHVDLTQLVQDELFRGGEEQKLSLSRAFTLMASEHRRSPHVELLLFEVPENLPRPAGDRFGQP